MKISSGTPYQPPAFDSIKKESKEVTSAESVTSESPIKDTASNKKVPESFDQAKVDAIKSAIREGSLEINAEKIADKLIGNTLDLIG